MAVYGVSVATSPSLACIFKSDQVDTGKDTLNAPVPVSHTSERTASSYVYPASLKKILKYVRLSKFPFEASPYTCIPSFGASVNVKFIALQPEAL